MKKPLLLILLALAVCRPAARAQDNAIFEIQYDHQLAQRIVIALDSDSAPTTVANFEKLIRHHFYTGLKIHRIIPHSLVQMGDPLTRGHDASRIGTGGPGYTLPPEIHLRHTAGAVGMSRLPDSINPGRRSSGSQFYICLKPMPDLDSQYTVFGHVTEGMDALDGLSIQQEDTNDYPTTPIFIRSARVISGPVPAPPAPAGHHFSLWPPAIWPFDR